MVPRIIVQPGMEGATAGWLGRLSGPYVSQPMELREVSGSSKLPFTKRLTGVGDVGGGGGGAGNGGRTSSEAVSVRSPARAVRTTGVIAVTGWVVIGKVALIAIAGTRTLAGTCTTLAWLLASATVTPPAPAGQGRETSPVVAAPPMTAFGVSRIPPTPPGRTTKAERRPLPWKLARIVPVCGRCTPITVG